MTFSRGWSLAVLFAPVAILSAGEALASGRPLPAGIHLGKSGRYYRDVCPASDGPRCLSTILLPKGFDPDAVPIPEAQPSSFCAQTQSPEGEANVPASSMGPDEIITAYAVPAATAAHGKIVAVIDMPDVTAFTDLTAYRAGYPSLGALPACSGGLPDGKTPCFAAVDEAGNPDPTITDCPAADPETSLDMDMISSACPDCAILLVQLTDSDPTNGPSEQDLVNAVATATKLGAVATSISFGGPEKVGGEGDPTGYSTATNVVFAASGDTGYLLEGESGAGTSPSYPASSPDVVGVGGTLLSGAVGGTFSEVVWNDENGAGGSGCSIEFPMPAYQATFGTQNFGSCAMRASVDLSAAADYLAPGATVKDPVGGIAEYDSYNKWTLVAGTSAASPMVAALMTRLGVTAAIANDFGFIYTNAAAFNDVTSGTNDGFDNRTLCTTNDVICTAGKGWDGPTGVGTPNGPKLAALGGEPVQSPSDAGADGGKGEADSGPPAEDGGRGVLVTTTTTKGCSCDAPGSDAPFGGAGGIGALGAMGMAAGRRRRSRARSSV